MAAMKPEQIAAVAFAAGARDKATVARAVAVALAESSGDPSKVNNNPGTGDLSYGLWQINMLGSLGPARRKEFGISRNEELLDPGVNAKAAAKVSNGWKNWTPWSVFKSNAYLKYMPEGEKAAAKVVGEFGELKDTSIVEDVAESGIPGAIQRGISNLAENLFRAGLSVGALVVALVLLVLGVVILMRDPLAKVAKTAAQVAPAGKLAAGAGKVAKVL